MESIIWFLVIGGLFYFMMKHGCGAHMGGHGGHGGGHKGHAGHREGPPTVSQKVKESRLPSSSFSVPMGDT